MTGTEPSSLFNDRNGSHSDSVRPRGDIECRVEPPLRQRASDVDSCSAVQWMHSMMASSENHHGSD